jgi:hypothetical protein
MWSFGFDGNIVSGLLQIQMKIQNYHATRLQSSKAAWLITQSDGIVLARLAFRIDCKIRTANVVRSKRGYLIGIRYQYFLRKNAHLSFLLQSSATFSSPRWTGS